MMNDIKIRFISESKVRPLISTPGHHHDHNGGLISEITAERIELTPCDLQLLKIHYIQKGLVFHKLGDSSITLTSTTNLVQRLKASLSQTLDLLYPLAGRLAVTENDDETASFHVDCNGAGALFVHAVMDGVTVADILEPAIIPDDIVYSFFQLNGVFNYEAAFSKLPLLAVQVTELADGFFVGCSMNHVVVDGTSFWNFLNVWSQISRGGGCYNVDDVVSRNSHSVDFGRQRDYFDGTIDLPIQFPFSHHNHNHNHNHNHDHDHHGIVVLQHMMFHFSKEKIAELKAKANADMGFAANNGISSLQAILAHLWISVTRGRDLDPSEEVRYRVAVGLRPRLQPPLPEGYLGNAVRSVTVQSTAGKLVERGLGWAAAQIGEAIRSLTATEVKEFLEDWVKSPVLTDFGKLPPNSLFTGSSPRFNVYGNDFGWGRPVAVRTGPANKSDGKMTAFPGTEEGSVDFEVCLSPETLEAMQYFIGN
ncbi:Transferase [Parasponia andersonii]|uniref:Transferase n=1 Tax=Parasponia andersonii TaxID=3476 RepID=A0A2P5B2H8_PARAD|nr:Transferase [Parasponia andersonii]